MLNLENEADLMRFAGEEMSLDEENDALLQCEANPELWRNVALAFIENRQLETSLKKIAASEAGTGQPTTQTSIRRGWYERANIVMAACLFFALGASISAIVMLEFSRSDNTGSVAEKSKNKSPVLVYVRPPVTNEAKQVRASYPAIEEIAELVQPMFNTEARELMRQSGLDVEERINVYYVESESGRPYAIPDRQIRFVEFKN